MSVYVRIPRSPFRGYKWKRYDTVTEYTWEEYFVLYQWLCNEYYLEYEFSMYVAVDGEKQEDMYLGIEWRDSPFYEYDGGPTYYEYTGNSRPVDSGYTYTVDSDYRYSYPDSGQLEPDTGHIYYYSYVGSSKGSPTNYPDTNTVVNTNINAYPQDGEQDGYWYVLIASEYKNSGLNETIVSDSNPDAYPENGRHTDGYWYVKVT